MKKNIIYGVSTLFFAFTSCNSANNHKFHTNYGEIQKTRLENLVHRDYLGIDENSKVNNQYLLDNIKEDDIDKLLHPGIIKREIYEKLSNMEHICSENFDSYCRGTEEKINSLTPRQLLRIYYLLENLEKKEFVNKIGELVDKDYQDEYSEHGGVILIDHGKINLFELKSEKADESNPINNFVYKLPIESLKNPYIFEYHFHSALYDNSLYSHPSISTIELNGLLVGDLSVARENIYANGETHEIVISKIKDNKINIDYYGGELVEGQLQFTILDLGVYDY